MENSSEDESTMAIPSSSGDEHSTPDEIGAQEADQDSSMGDLDEEQVPADDQVPVVTAQAVNVACSIVKSCLAQICMYFTDININIL